MHPTLITAADSGIFTIGRDLPVHRLGFGAMRLTGPGIWGEPKNPDEARRVLLRTIDQGADLWAPVGRAEYLRQQLEMSLRRLRVDCIELYQLHRIDPRVPMEESLGAFRDFQTEGKIRHIGLSEVTPDEIEKARLIVDIVTVQNRYNLLDREHEPALRYCEQHKLGFIPWFPVGAGKLARTGGPLDQVARRHSVSVAQLSIAWLLHHSPVMLPIPGTSSVLHLEENVASVNLRLDEREWGALEQAMAKQR